MEELFPNVTVDVANESDWIELAKQRKKDSGVHLNSVFSKAAKDNSGSPKGELYELLAQLFSMYFKGDDPNEPFAPMMQFGAQRTAIVSDFTDKNLDLVENLVGLSNDNVVDGRLADIIWLRRRKLEFGQAALAAYIRHAEETLSPEKDGWIYAKESFLRACQLWKQLGRPDKFTQLLQELVGKSIDLDSEEPKDFYRIITTRVVVEYGLCTEPVVWASKCDTLHEKMMSENYFEKARDYLEIAERLSLQVKDSESAQKYRKLQVDCYVTEARHLNKDGLSAMIVADRYTKAIEACRRHGGLRELIDELHLEMNKTQEKVLGELSEHSMPVNVTPLVEHGRKIIEDADSDEALTQAIASTASPQKKGDLRKSAEEIRKKFPLAHLVSGVSFNDKGRVVARSSATIASSEEDNEAGILSQMIFHCRQDIELNGVSQIASAREALNKKIGADSRIFENLVTMNLFVPEGREAIYVQGLKAGLRGDKLTCAHLLIPQLEHSIRTILEASGALVTRLTSGMVQKEHDLNKILYMEETEKMFGEDVVFYLRVLLVEELGGNYRNELAHGLIRYDRFYGGWVNYLWAMTIRLCWIGKTLSKKEVGKEQ